MRDPGENARRRLVLACRVGIGMLLLQASALPFALRVGVDNRMELWLDEAGSAAQAHLRLRERFGSDEFLVIALEGAGLLSAQALEAQLSAVERIEALPSVRRVLAPATLYRDYFAAGALDALQRELLATPFWRDFLVSDGGAVLGLYVETEPAPGATARTELLTGIADALAPLERGGVRAAVAGPPALNAALDAASRREGPRTFPVAFGLSLLVIGIALRSWRGVAVAAVCASGPLVLTLAAMALAGRALNMVSAVLPSLLWVLSLSGAIHLVERTRSRMGRGATPEAALAGALDEVARPCSLSAVTTALGFASLGVAGMRPVRELGAFAALGLVFSLVTTLSVTPLLVRLWGVPAAGPAGRGSRFARLGARVGRRGRGVLAAGGLAGAMLALGCLGLRVESDPLGFLPEDSATVRAYRAVGERLTGYYSLETLVRVPSGWLDPAAWPALDGLAADLAATPGVARVLSPLDFLRQQNARDHGLDRDFYRLPSSGADAQMLVDEFDLLGGGEATGLVAEGGRLVRLSALVNVMPSKAFYGIVDRTRAALGALPAPLEGEVTGVVLRLVDAQSELVDSQIRSFGLAFLTVFLCVGASLRSVRLLLAAIPVNLLPVLAALAVMGVLGIALDAATVMMASVALGIAVDDTIHLFAAWQSARDHGADGPGAVTQALGAVGPAMVLTTAAATVGFLALLGSSFVPIRTFGLLSAVALVVALAADLVLAPALLVRIGRSAP